MRLRRMKNKFNKLNPTWIAVVLCVVTMFIYWMSYMDIRNIEYPLDNEVSAYDPYVQQFDAFKKGQLHLDWEVDSRLLELENPYGRGARAGIDYLWDRALYEGKYYSYFGVTPIVTVIYPFYLVGGVIPGAALIQLVYMLMFAVFFPKVLMLLLDKNSEKVSPIIKVLITYTAYLSSFNLLFGRGKNPFYYIACTAAIAFLTLFAYLFFKGIYENCHKKRCLYFLFAGLAYALCFHARVNTAFTAVFFIAPIVLFKIIGGKIEVKKKLIELSCLGFFVAIGFGISFAYNYARFGNALEFGSIYQLTVTDVSEYKLDISEFDDAVDYYFKSEPKEDIEKGELVFSDKDKESVDRYLYVADYFGLFFIPFNVFGLLVAVIIFVRDKSWCYRVTICATFAGAFIMAWINFCLGGVIFRYLADFSVEIAVVAAMAIALLFEKSHLFTDKRVKILLQMVIIFFVLVSIYKIWKILVINSGNLYNIREDSMIGRIFNVKSKV